MSKAPSIPDPPEPSPDERPEPGEPHSRHRRWAWWHRQQPLTRKSVRAVALLLITGLAAGVVGIFTAEASSSLGPHAASYSVSARHEVMLDLGPLGAIIIDSPLPWPLGVDVVVKEIPAELTAVPTNPVTGLADDLAAYAQVFAQPEAAVADAARALVSDAVSRTVLVWSLLLVLIAAGRYASRGLLRREAGAALRRRGVLPVVVTVALSLVALQVVAVGRQPHLEGQPITALDGTPLEGIRMTGRMGELIDTYGGMAVEAYEDNERFYGDAAENLRAAYDADDAPLRPLSLLSPSPPPDGDEEPAGDQNGDTDTDTDDDADTDSGSTQPAFSRSEDGAVTALFVSDLHCNVGMASVINAALERSEADLLIDAGDTVMSGTTVESYCVNAFAGEIPDDVPAVVATGNHDSVTTAQQLHEAGYLVLGGDVVEVAGLRLLGDTDPTLTAVGEGTRPEREETFLEMGERLADVACQARDKGQPADLLVVHNPLATQATLASGCVPLTLSGHKHRRMGPEVEGHGVRYVSSSTAGAVSSQPTVGPLSGTAEMTVLRIDPDSGTPLAHRIIQVGTDAQVALSEWYSFPQPQPDPDPSFGPGGDLLPTPDDDALPGGGPSDGGNKKASDEAATHRSRS